MPMTGKFLLFFGAAKSGRPSGNHDMVLVTRDRHFLESRRLEDCGLAAAGVTDG